MSWCIRENNFRSGYNSHPFYKNKPADFIAAEMKKWHPKSEEFELLQGAVAGAVARDCGVNLLPSEAYDAPPLVRGELGPGDVKTKKQAAQYLAVVLAYSAYPQNQRTRTERSKWARWIKQARDIRARFPA